MKVLSWFSVGIAPQPGAETEAQDFSGSMQTARDNKRNLSGSSSVSCKSFAFPSLLGCERPPDGGPLASCFSGDSRCVSSEAFFGPPSRFTCSCFTAPRGYGSTSTYVCACVRKYFLLLSPAQLYGESSLESKLRPHALLFSSPLRLLLVFPAPTWLLPRP